MKKRKRLKSSVSYIVMILIAVIHMIPLAVMFLNSVRSNDAIRKRLIAFPEEIHWENCDRMDQRRLSGRLYQ